MKISAHSPRIFCLTALASLALMGCRNPKPVSYQAPKDVESAVAPVTTGAPAAPAQPSATPPGHPDIGNAPASAMASMANTAVITADGAGLRWTAPAHWAAKAVSSMRKGSYTVTGADGATADLAITAFPGDVGGEVANVNRWRGQLQLAPLPEAEAVAAIDRVTYNGLAIGIVSFANTASPTPQRIQGAMVPHQGATWFFKLTGPDAVVTQENAAFREFLKTVQPATPTP